MILQIFVAFVGTLTFSILFNVSRHQCLFCGLTGAAGWLVYLITMQLTNSQLICTFFSSFALTAISRALSTIRKAPTTLFLLSGIFTLVPGAGMYYTTFHIFMNDNSKALFQGVLTIKIALAISFGIAVGYTLPPSLFGWGKETVEENSVMAQLAEEDDDNSYDGSF